jgi:hypothetical protein
VAVDLSLQTEQRVVLVQAHRQVQIRGMVDQALLVKVITAVTTTQARLIQAAVGAVPAVLVLRVGEANLGRAVLVLLAQSRVHPLLMRAVAAVVALFKARFLAAAAQVGAVLAVLAMQAEQAALQTQAAAVAVAVTAGRILEVAVAQVSLSSAPL